MASSVAANASKDTALAAGAPRPFRARLTPAAQCRVHQIVLGVVLEEAARVSPDSMELLSGRVV